MTNALPARRLAVVLFNLGGPDSLPAVQPFLFNLFNDPAIIGLPWPVRPALARFIAGRRREEASANYEYMGGGSPLLPETEAQAEALQARISERLPGAEIRCFIAMRYWRPFTADAAKAVEAFAPDDVVLVPLYPQYSTTTTASSIKAWRGAYRGRARVHEVCCFFDGDGLVEAHAQRIRATFEEAGRPDRLRLLFSAHGLPERVIEGGDPYQWQVERTCEAVSRRLGPEWDWRVCYQSRVGPLKWIGPSTPQAIQEAASEGRGVLVAPIAFVSEHVETLVELDRDYADLAEQEGCPVYLRAPAVGVLPDFIDMLADATEKALQRLGCAPYAGACTPGLTACPYRRGLEAG